ncbi:hypothetical protein [Streptomyces hesseae]|uniref:Adenylyl-sulfate kinase n=1 Tax=Streptomyces hesseae TaxID=3075519 RepID=A0ABU2SKM8_9ACTN|nr:hypothetical protein [Streptomyces sp. DSM 40473]MDT0448335.1 hypothetical protein [Streptomyces sp. DSM 40473]
MPATHHRTFDGEPSALLITGTVGVGKTSTADLLSGLLADAGVPHAVIDLDRLCQAWPPPDDDPFHQRLLLGNLRAVTTNYRSFGVRHLVLAGVAENAAERNAYQAALGMSLQVCRLTADLPTIHGRLRQRHEADHDTESLPWHLERAEELDLVLDRAAITDIAVDTTHLAPADVAATVLEATGWIRAQ